MRGYKLFINIILFVSLMIPASVMAQSTPRSRTYRPPQRQQVQPRHNGGQHYGNQYHNRYYGNQYHNRYHYYAPRPYYRYPPTYYGGGYYRGGSGGIVYGGVVGTYGTFGYVYEGYRYIPPPIYTNPPQVYPATPQEVIQLEEGAMIVVGDKVITNKNGRIVVYEAAPQ